jgi:hypothetical protein
VNVECDTEENFKDDQEFFTVFPAIMFCFELRAKFFIKMYFFILFTLIYCIKGYPELKDSLFEFFKF